MNFEQATRVFQESEIISYRGSYPRDIETYIMIKFPKNPLKQTKMEELLEKEKRLVKPKEFPEVVEIIKSPTGRDHDLEDLLYELHDVAVTCNSSEGNYAEYIRFLIDEVIPFKSRQHDIVNAFDLDTSNTKPFKIEYRALCHSFVIAVDNFAVNPMNITEIGDCIIQLIDGVFYCEDITASDNIFVEYTKAKWNFGLYNTLLRYLSKYEEDGTIDMDQPIEIQMNNVTESSIYEDIFEDPKDVYFESDTTTVDSKESMILLFGDNIFHNVNNEDVKREIRHLNRDTIESYIAPTMKGTVNFQLDPQFKAYLQQELGCKMMVSQVKREDQVDEVTLIDAEGDKFLLFTLQEKPEEVYGISMSFQDINPIRRLITFFKDDEVSYKFIDKI